MGLPQSGEYRTLMSRLAELRRHLLPATLDPTRSYTARQIDRILGYRLLAHAEIEHCLERLVTETVGYAWTGYQADSRPRTCLMALVAYYDGDLGGAPRSLMIAQKPKRMLVHLDERINRARNHHVGVVVRGNHGLSEQNILQMLMPVGVASADLDPIWLTDATSFSEDRGQAAHMARRMQQPPDPVAELRRVRELAKGLGPVDKRLLTLRTG
jgi:hypothetical protein